MIISDFSPFVGQHCETVATGNVLKHLGIELSEPMLFGIGEGLGFLYWNMKSMGQPFIGGRIKTDLLTANICRNLDLKLTVKKTSSLKKAWSNVSTALAKNEVVGLKLDCYHLEYFSSKIHFAGHYVALYGYDDRYAYLVDTEQQGGQVKTTLEQLALARSEKGPMSSPNLSYTISGRPPSKAVLLKAIKSAIVNNATDFLNPPIKNVGYKGMIKTSKEIKKWFKRSKDVKAEFQLSASLMERGGTGGALFRNLYTAFLKESFELLEMPVIHEAHVSFKSIAKKWTKVSSLFHAAGETGNIEYINEAADVLVDLSALEKETMEKLMKI